MSDRQFGGVSPRKIHPVNTGPTDTGVRQVKDAPGSYKKVETSQPFGEEARNVRLP